VSLSTSVRLDAQLQFAIALTGVNKQFGEMTVVRDLSLTIPIGEMFGLLGPNGAGKSTTVRMLTTLTRPTAGTLLVGGLDVTQQPLKVRETIGIVLQQISLNNDRTVWENLEYHGRLHHIPAAERQQRIDRWLGYVELSDRRDSLVKTLSGGMKRRLQIARALLHQPRILFLDEPTVGLDPQARRLLWDIIRNLKQQGMTILLTTHYMDEAEALCDRVGIMDRGELVAVDSPAVLRQKVGEALVVSYPSSGTGGANRSPDYLFFPDLAAATTYIESQPNRMGLLARPSNLEDIFVALTGHALD
jgi:ABC-2 type transport system ATP-binding protein